MRTEGTLKRWNDEKGFGFITPVQGGPDVFVHVSAFQRDGERPVEGERLSYDVERGADGRLRAVRVLQQGAKAVHVREPAGPVSPSGSRPVSPRRLPEPARSSRATPVLLAAVTAVALGAWGYHTFVRSRHMPVVDVPVLAVPSEPKQQVITPPPVETAPVVPPPVPAPRIEPAPAPLRVPQDLPVSRFSCDGRTHCSQMTSCAEATFFLQHCPGVKMDGNGDGVPCEMQWCN